MTWCDKFTMPTELHWIDSVNVVAPGLKKIVYFRWSAESMERFAHLQLVWLLLMITNIVRVSILHLDCIYLGCDNNNIIRGNNWETRPRALRKRKIQAWNKYTRDGNSVKSIVCGSLVTIFLFIFLWLYFYCGQLSVLLCDVRVQILLTRYTGPK